MRCGRASETTSQTRAKDFVYTSGYDNALSAKPVVAVVAETWASFKQPVRPKYEAHS